RVPRARPHLLVGDARRVVLVVAPAHEGEALHGRRLLVDDPHVALGRGFDAGHAVLEPRRGIAQPEVGWRVHVGVGGDELDRHGGGLTRGPAWGQAPPQGGGGDGEAQEAGGGGGGGPPGARAVYGSSVADSPRCAAGRAAGKSP